jgi:hypothetical protein
MDAFMSHIVNIIICWSQDGEQRNGRQCFIFTGAKSAQATMGHQILLKLWGYIAYTLLEIMTCLFVGML